MRPLHRRVRRSEWCFLCSAERWNCVQRKKLEAIDASAPFSSEAKSSEVHDGSVTGNKSWRKAIPVSLLSGITASLRLFGYADVGG